MIDTEITSFKAQISSLQSKQADFEQLKKDLEAL
jgi:prefoldin subunit 5